MFLAVLLVLALAVWLIPAFMYARLPALLALILAIGTVFGPAFFAVDGPVQISIDRVLFGVLCCVAFLSVRSSRASIPTLNAIDCLVIVYTAWVFVSSQRGEASPGTSPIGGWLFYVLFPSLTYFIARVAHWETIDLKQVENVLLILGVYLAVTSFFESRGWYALVFPKFIADPKHWEFLGRGRGPLLNPSANGIVMTIGLAVAAVRLLRAEHQQGKLGYGMLVLMMLLGLYGTLTRSVWIGAGLAIAIVYWKVTPNWTKTLAFLTVLLLAGFAVAGLKDELLKMKRDKNLSASEAEKSVQLRPLLAIVAYEMFKDAPVLGHGFGHYERESQPYFSLRGYGMPLEIARDYHQHNVLLSVLVDNGLIGLAMFSTLLMTWLRRGWSLAREVVLGPLQSQMGLIVNAGIAGYLTGGMFQDVTIMPMINMYLFFLGGCAISLTTSLAIHRAPVREFTPEKDDRETATVDKAFQPSAC